MSSTASGFTVLLYVLGNWPWSINQCNWDFLQSEFFNKLRGLACMNAPLFGAQYLASGKIGCHYCHSFPTCGGPLVFGGVGDLQFGTIIPPVFRVSKNLLLVSNVHYGHKVT